MALDAHDYLRGGLIGPFFFAERGHVTSLNWGPYSQRPQHSPRLGGLGRLPMIGDNRLTLSNGPFPMPWLSFLPR